MNTPTKTQELEALDHMIATLGPDSYIGQWMKAGTREAIERDLRSDFPIDARLPYQINQDARKDADAITDRAKRDAEVIISRAHVAATFITDAADKYGRAEVERANRDAAAIRADLDRTLRAAGFTGKDARS